MIEIKIKEHTDMNFETVRDVIAESLGCDVEQVTMEAASDTGISVPHQKAVSGCQAAMNRQT